MSPRDTIGRDRVRTGGQTCSSLLPPLAQPPFFDLSRASNAFTPRELNSERGSKIPGAALERVRLEGLRKQAFSFVLGLDLAHDVHMGIQLPATRHLSKSLTSDYKPNMSSFAHLQVVRKGRQSVNLV